MSTNSLNIICLTALQVNNITPSCNIYYSVADFKRISKTAQKNYSSEFAYNEHKRVYFKVSNYKNIHKIKKLKNVYIQ